MAEEILPSFNLEGAFTQQNFLTIIFWVILIIGSLVFLIFCLFGIWYMTYRIKVRYYQVIGKPDSQGKESLRFIGTDKAKLIKDKGQIYRLRFFWKRRKIEPPPTDAYLSTRRGYEMHVKTNGIDFDPMSLKSNPGFETIAMHKRLWLLQTHKIAMEQYSKPSFWDKYGTLLMTFGTIILLIGLAGFTVWYSAKLGGYSIDKAAATAVEIAKMKVAPGA